MSFASKTVFTLKPCERDEKLSHLPSKNEHSMTAGGQKHQETSPEEFYPPGGRVDAGLAAQRAFSQQTGKAEPRVS